MLKRFLAVLAVLFLCGTTAAQATIVGPLPYTLTNGTTADAAQVMANFNKLVNDINTNVIFPSFSQQNYYAADTGAANSMVVTLSPAPTSYTAGMVVSVKVATANTGATVINANGLGSQSVVNLDGSALKSQQLLAGMTAQLIYDGTRFQLISLAPYAVRQLSTPIGTDIFTTPGAWTWTAPAGVYFVRVEMWGGGGGGGSVSAANGASGGGGGGAFGRVFVTLSPGDILSGVVGAGGAGGTAGGNGVTGITSTLLLNGVNQGTATGGVGGTGVAGGAARGGNGGSVTGVLWAFSATGQTGGSGAGSATANALGGTGGQAVNGGVGGDYVFGVGCGGGGNPGGGGSGTSSANPGCAGGNGWIYLEY